MKQQSQPSPHDDSAIVSNFLDLFVRAFAVTIEVFLHHRFGSRYLGAQAAMGLVLMPLFTVFFPHANPFPLLAMTGLYLGFCVLARVDVLRRVSKGEREHSYYSGWPYLMAIFRGWSELTVKQYVECLLAFIAGILLLPLNQPLGLYLMLAGLCVGACYTAYRGAERKRLRDMNDSLIDQRRVAEQFRETHGNGF